MQQTATDPGMGQLLCFQQVTKGEIVPEGIEIMIDPVGQILMKIGVKGKVFSFFRQQPIMKQTGKIIDSHRESTPIFLQKHFMHRIRKMGGEGKEESFIQSLPYCSGGGVALLRQPGVMIAAVKPFYGNRCYSAL